MRKYRFRLKRKVFLEKVPFYTRGIKAKCECAGFTYELLRNLLYGQGNIDQTLTTEEKATEFAKVLNMKVHDLFDEIG